MSDEGAVLEGGRVRGEAAVLVEPAMKLGNRVRGQTVVAVHRRVSLYRSKQGVSRLIILHLPCCNIYL